MTQMPAAALYEGGERIQQTASNRAARNRAIKVPLSKKKVVWSLQSATTTNIQTTVI